LRFLLIVADELLLLVVIFQELRKFFAIEIFHMECDRDELERINFLGLVVALHVIEESLLVAQMPVILEMVVYLHACTIIETSHLISFKGFYTTILQQRTYGLKVFHIFLTENSSQILIIYPELRIYQLTFA
jgi:hypothetical protein